MTTKTKQLDLRSATPEEIAAAARPGVVATLRAHKRAGIPAVIWDHETERTVIVPPEQIPDFPDESTELTRPELIPHGRPAKS